MLSRKMLKGMNLTDEQVDSIIEAHSETVNALKEKIEDSNGDVKKVETLTKELEDVKKELNEAKETIEKGNKDTYKVKYEALKEDYEKYKSGIDKEKTLANKSKAYITLLKGAGISEKRIDSILKVTDLESLEIDEEGKFKDVDSINKNIVEEWSDFIEKKGEQGANTPNPPAQNNKTFTREDISKMSVAEINANYDAIKEVLKN